MFGCRVSAWPLWLLVVACGDDTERPDTTLADTLANETVTTDDVALDADVETIDRWAEVDRLARETMAAEGIVDAGLVVYDADDRLVFERMYGDFAPDRRLAVASASKLIAGLVLFDLVADGLLALDDTTASVLGWQGDGSTITLEQLMAFTSGLERDRPCTALPNISLAQCVDAIHEAAIATAPGTRFDYGSTHLHVAGRMAEVVSGKAWNTLFRERLGDPLGLPTDVLFYTAPRQGTGTTNPLVAGGLRASMRDYAPMLAMVFHRGPLGEPALFAAQAVEPYPDATIGYSPYADAGLPYHYGLASWLECTPPVTRECAIVASPGAFGFTPWVDREHGYYAIFATEAFGLSTGVAASSVRVSFAVRPAILAALP